MICTKCFKAPYYTRCGTTFMGKTPSTEDAHIVKKLRDGGAIIIGIANMHELGIGTTGNNPNRWQSWTPYHSMCNQTIYYNESQNYLFYISFGWPYNEILKHDVLVTTYHLFLVQMINGGWRKLSLKLYGNKKNVWKYEYQKIYFHSFISVYTITNHLLFVFDNSVMFSLKCHAAVSFIFILIKRNF